MKFSAFAIFMAAAIGATAASSEVRDERGGGREAISRPFQWWFTLASVLAQN